jgi:hypothetical protein
MPKHYLLLTFLLAGCAAGRSVGEAMPGAGGHLKEAPAAKTPSPDEDPHAPGQIPVECEQLLNRSRDWGFLPEKSWKPANAAQAREAADFFASFHLVPESTSNFATAWLKEPAPKTPAAAQRSLDRMDRAQSCDFLLAHKLLLALLSYHWMRKDRPDVAQDFHYFIANQQSRVSPSMARAVQIDVLGKAIRRGFVKADGRKVAELRKWFDEKSASGLARAEHITDPLEQWKLNYEELELSEEARARLEKLLPQP